MMRPKRFLRWSVIAVPFRDGAVDWRFIRVLGYYPFLLLAWLGFLRFVRRGPSPRPVSAVLFFRGSERVLSFLSGDLDGVFAGVR